MFQDAMLSPASVQAMPAPQRTAENFLWHDRLGLMLGAAAFGGAAGFVATLALGRLDAWVAPLCIAPVYVAAIFVGGGMAYEAWGRRAWATFALLAVHLLAIMAWPAVFVLPPEQGVLLALAAPLSLMLLVAVRIAPQAFNYTSMQSAIVGGLAVSQAAAFMLGA